MVTGEMEHRSDGAVVLWIFRKPLSASLTSTLLQSTLLKWVVSNMT